MAQSRTGQLCVHCFPLQATVEGRGLSKDEGDRDGRQKLWLRISGFRLVAWGSPSPGFAMCRAIVCVSWFAGNKVNGWAQWGPSDLYINWAAPYCVVNGELGRAEISIYEPTLTVSAVCGYSTDLAVT